jgi:hypothetical protein
MGFDPSLIGFTPTPDDPFPYPRPRPFPWPWPPCPRPWPFQIAELAASPLLIAAVQAELGGRIHDKLGAGLVSAAHGFIDDYCGTVPKKGPPVPGPGPWPWVAVSLLETAKLFPDGVGQSELQRAAGLLITGR